MKKILFILLFLGILIPVYAANYTMKELIPVDTKTTIRGEHLLYKNFYYKKGAVHFESIKNNSEETQKLSISIGLFDKNQKNIGTINYCSEDMVLASKQEKTEFLLEVKKSYLGEDYTIKDIKYIAVLSENISCRTDGSNEFIGQTVEQIGMGKNNTLTKDEMLVVNIFKVIGVALFALFLYKVLFTNAYRNMDGEDVRQEYSYINKQLKKKREKDLKENPPQPKVVKTDKTKEILEQEKIQAEKDALDDSDLHNFYK